MQTTYGLLCCRSSSGDDRLGSSSGEHAEQRLLQSEPWQLHIKAILSVCTGQAGNSVCCKSVHRCHSMDKLFWKELSVSMVEGLFA
jgi:hypothetical protein